MLDESMTDPQSADEMMRMLGETARKRPFDYAIDWFPGMEGSSHGLEGMRPGANCLPVDYRCRNLRQEKDFKI
jgi:hypothetical protein